MGENANNILHLLCMPLSLFRFFFLVWSKEEKKISYKKSSNSKVSEIEQEFTLMRNNIF